MVVEKLTHHRGIFHSLPAVLLSVLLTLTLMDYFVMDTKVKMTISFAVGIGYLCHLILDEINSIVNLEGIPFIPKKSIGTALKFYSKDWKITVGVYLLTGWLLFQNMPAINKYLIELR